MAKEKRVEVQIEGVRKGWLGRLTGGRGERRDQEGNEVNFRMKNRKMDPQEVRQTCNGCVAGNDEMRNCSTFDDWGRAELRGIDDGVVLATLRTKARVRVNCGLPEAIEGQLSRNDQLRWGVEEVDREILSRAAKRRLEREGGVGGVFEGVKKLRDYEKKAKKHRR